MIIPPRSCRKIARDAVFVGSEVGPPMEGTHKWHAAVLAPDGCYLTTSVKNREKRGMRGRWFFETITIVPVFPKNRWYTVILSYFLGYYVLFADLFCIYIYLLETTSWEMPSACHLWTLQVSMLHPAMGARCYESRRMFHRGKGQGLVLGIPDLQRLLHPGRLTWNLKMMVWKMIFLFNWVIFRFHVNLPGGDWNLGWCRNWSNKYISYEIHRVFCSASASGAGCFFNRIQPK